MNQTLQDLLKSLHDEIYRTKKDFPETIIWAGAVCTLQGCKFLAESGADAAIIGNGVGSVCETTPRTGVGLPVLQTLEDCMLSPIPTILAGGIRNIGDIVKALCLGADLVMIGGLVSRCKDTQNFGKRYCNATKKQT